MRICHLTSAHPAKDIRIYHKECKSLAKYGFKVTIIAPKIDDHIDHNITFKGILNNSKSRIFRFLFITNKIFKKAIEINADVYHFHDPELLRIAMKLKKNGKKVIYDVHEDVPLQILAKHWINPLISKLISRFFNAYEKKIASKLDYIITATTIIRDKFLQINKNVIDINNYPEPTELKDCINWESRENEICYIGGIFRIRGIFEILDVLKKYKLNLAGSFSPPDLENEVINHKNWKNVNYFGFVGREKIKKMLNQSKIGLMTLHPTKNFIESQPIKMFEYMSASIPVIASNFPMWKEIIEKYNCGICVDPLDVNEISKAIEILMNDDKLAEEMGKNGRKAVEDMFNWETEEKKLVEIYKKLSIYD